ncbi:transporter protein [Arthrobacter sp. Hiyo6]|nr:transporter protein [Arthrobacter sp. Hiyo6]
MPIDRSTTDSPAGVYNASGTNQMAPQGVRKPKLLARRRLKESDVNVVDQPMLKKARRDHRG